MRIQLKRFSFKSLMIILVVLLMWSVVIPSTTIYADSHLAQVENDHVIVYVDKQSGRFVIDTVEGHPKRDRDNHASLLFGGKHPKTSFTTFRINNEDYIYGNNYGFLGMTDTLVEEILIPGLAYQSQWTVKDQLITQTFTLVDDPDHPNLGNVKITYTVQNTGAKAVEIGSRILLDTKLGANDAALMSFEGRAGFVEHETDVSSEDVPKYWRAVDNPYDPHVAAYGLLSGWGNLAPDRMIVGHWSGMGHTKWDYMVDSNLDFTRPNNVYGTSDSAVAMYWNPQTLSPGETRTYETYYGVGNFDSGHDAASFDTVLTGPTELTVNTAKNDYVDGIFDIHLLVDNTFSDAKVLKNVKIEIGLPWELELQSGQRMQTISQINANETRNFSWTVKAIPQSSYKSSRYWVSVQADGEEEVIKAAFTLLPSVSGAPPAVQVLELLPGKKFTGDEEHQLKLVGKGLSLLQHSGDVSLSMSEVNGDVSKNIPLHSVMILDNEMTIDVQNAWGDIPDAGLYQFELNAGELGTFTKQFEYTDDPAYRSRQYGLLAITKSDKNYQLAPVTDETALSRLSDEVLLVFRGNVNEIKKDKQFEIKPGSTINSVIRFDESEDVFKWFGQDQKMTISQTEDGIELEGMGTLSIPNFTFTSGEFGINLENGTNYSLHPTKICENTGTFPEPQYFCEDLEGYVNQDPDEEEMPIQIIWPYLTWLENMGVLSALPVSIRSVTIGDESVSFGGHVNLSLGGKKSKERVVMPPEESKKWPPDPIRTEEDEGHDPFTLMVDVKEARFGKLENGEFGISGVRAMGEVEIPPGLIPGIDIGGSAFVLINTFEQEYYIEVAASFEIIEIEGQLGLRFTDANVPIVDSFVFVIGAQPGIPITPATPIAYITKAGGGFENLYDTIMGNYNVRPPLTLVLKGALDVAKVVEADNMELSMSLQEIKFSGDFEIMNVPILKQVFGQIAIADSDEYTGVDVQVGATLNIPEVMDGAISATFSYDSRRSGLFGPVYLAGQGELYFYIPKSFPIGGGVKIGGVEAELSTKQVMGKVVLLGAGIGIAYDWSTGEVKLASNGELDPEAFRNFSIPVGFDTQHIFDPETGELMGTLVLGTNVTQGDQLKKISHHQVRIASGESYDEYTLEVEDDHAYFALQYFGDKPILTGDSPDLIVKTPSGKTYTLIEELRDEDGIVIQQGNITFNDIPAAESDSGLDEKWLYISALGTDEDGSPLFGERAELGIWTISSAIELKGYALNVASMPEITDVSAHITGADVTVEVHANDAAEGQTVAVYVKPSGNDDSGSGQLMVSPAQNVNISGGNAITTFTLPDSLPSGDYIVKVVLVDGEDNIHSLETDTSISFVNTKAPSAPNKSTISSLGNGFIKVDWEYPDVAEADGFALQLLDQLGHPIPGLGAILVEDGELRSAHIGGTYTNKETGEEVGIYPGETYKVAVSAFNLVGNQRVYSAPIISGFLTVPQPNPPDISLSLEDGTWVAKDEQYVTNKESVQLKLASNMATQTDVYLNHEFVFKQDNTTGWTETIDLLVDGTHVIEVVAFNEDGDMTSRTVRVHRDTKAPDLMIESPLKSEITDLTTVTVKGVAEPGSIVTVNGEVVATSSDGLFQTTLSMDGYFMRKVEIVAVDSVGNRSEYHAEVVSAGRSFERIEARVSGATWDADGFYKLAPGKVWDLQMIGIDENRSESIIEFSAANWGVLQGDAIGQITSDGQLDIQSSIAKASQLEGDLVLIASYALSDDYTLEDAVVIKVDHNGQTQPDENSGGREEEKDDDDTHERHDNTRSIDQKMNELLRSLIQAQANVRFFGAVMLASEGENLETLLELDQGSVLILTGTGAAVGYGKVIKPELYLKGNLVLFSEIYEFMMSEPVEFDQPPKLVIQLPEDAIPHANMIGIYWYNELKERWEYVGGEYNAQDGTLSAHLPHFSKYALLLNPNRTIFTDLKGRWSEVAVYRLNSIGIIDGYQISGDWVYKPTQTITRQEFMKLLVAAADVALESGSLPERYQDLDTVGKWARPYLQTALHHGWLNGVERNGSLWLEPNREISRAEAATLIARMLGDALDLNSEASTFTDRQQMPSWAERAVAAMQKTQLIRGYPDGSFRPRHSITREEAASMILEVLNFQYRIEE